MGVEHLPGSTGRRSGGQPGAETGDPLEACGRGRKDPHTGLYEWYEDVPDDIKGQGQGVSVLTLLEQWPLVECDFQSEYGIRLSTTDLSWREFLTRLTGLLIKTDTRLWRHFSTETDEGSQP